MIKYYLSFYLNDQHNQIKYVFLIHYLKKKQYKHTKQYKLRLNTYLDLK